MNRKEEVEGKEGEDMEDIELVRRTVSGASRRKTKLGCYHRIQFRLQFLLFRKHLVMLD